MDNAKRKYDAKQARRAMRNKLERKGDPARLLSETQVRINGEVVKCDHVRALDHYASKRAAYVARLGIHHDAARKADSQHLWQHRDTMKADDYMTDSNGRKPARGKETKRR